MNALVLVDGLSNRVRQVVTSFERVDEREFLPAALEVLETPPSPFGRMLHWFIIGFIVLAFTWSVFGKVDVLATAPGRIRPVGDVKQIQPLETGVVRAIHVRDGQQVKAGQPLIELDPTQATADRDRFAVALMRAQLDVARLTALHDGVLSGRGVLAMVAPAGAPADELARARATLSTQTAEITGLAGQLNGQIAAKTAEAAQAAAQANKLSEALPLISQREQVRRAITERGYGNRIAMLEAQQQLSDARNEINVQRARGAEVTAQRGALARQRDEAVARFTAQALDDLAKAKQQVTDYTEELRKSERRTALTTLRAPVDGTVEGLSIHTVGGVVTPAQRLMTVVPRDRDITVEVSLPNRDIGFVHEGQPAKVKIETFTFTRYGLIDGRVVSISRDALPVERNPGDNSNATPANGETAPAYTARIALSADSLMVDGARRALQPGMAVTAEIQTGRRTILDYLLSPIAKATSESLHER